MVHRVAITGLGIVDPFGIGLDNFFDKLCKGVSCVQHYVTDDKPTPINMPAVLCDQFDSIAKLGKPLTNSMDRHAQLGVSAAFDAWEQAGFDRSVVSSNMGYGVAWGTALGGTQTFAEGYKKLWHEGKERVSPLSVVLGMNNSTAAHISIQLGLGNSSLTYTVACASAAHAIGEAYTKIKLGQAQLMIAGGSDTPLSYGVVRAWDAMRVLAPGNEQTAFSACKPFDVDRKGFVLGEGAAALVLEDWDHAVSRGTTILAEIIGYGSSSDHSHLIRPDASGQVYAMQRALTDARISAEDVDYINMHGTATKEGDPSEVLAIKTLFGERAKSLPVSATKSMHGHMMGATGAVESVLTVMALINDRLPPTAHLEKLDPSCDGVMHIRNDALSRSGAKMALSNSFAFGGSNAVLAFRNV